MAGRQLTITVWVMLGFLLSLAGCEGDAKEKEMLAADAAKAKAELAKVQDTLKQTESEKDTLKGEMTKITDSLNKAKSEISTITQARDKLQNELSEGMAKISELESKFQTVSGEAAGSFRARSARRGSRLEGT